MRISRLLSIAAIAFVSALPLTVCAEDSALAKNKENLKQAYAEVFTAGKLEALEKYVASDVIEHQVPPGAVDPQIGAEAVKQFLTMFRTAFPDMKVEVLDMVAEGDKVVARCKLTGTHKGDFAGMAATGKSISVEMIDIVRMKDGKIAEHWGLSNDAAMMQQLSGK